MRAGTLRHKIEVQTPPVGKSPTGDLNTAWTNVCVCNARKEDLSGRELEAAQAIHAEVTVRFRLRYRAGIEPKMRVEFRADHFDIEAVLDREGRDRELWLLCSTGLKNG